MKRVIGFSALLIFCAVLCSCGGEVMEGSGSVSVPIPVISEATSEPEIEYRSYLTRETAYGEYMTVGSSKEYEYDEEGRQVRYYEYDGFGILSYGIMTSYGAENRISSEKYIDSNMQTEKTVEYFYDESGNETKENTYDPDGALWYCSSCAYDGFGRKIMTVFADGAGNTVYTVENVYESDGGYLSTLVHVKGIKRTAKCDKDGNILAQEDLNADGTLNYRTEYKYDDVFVHRVSARTEYGDGTWMEFDYHYDENGVIQYISYRKMSEEVTSKYIYRYDEYGNLISESSENLAGVPFSMTVYEYRIEEIRG